MFPYLNTLGNVYDNGKHYPDRTGAGRHRIFGAMETYDLNDGLPLVTTREIVGLKNAVKELVGFIRGNNTVEGLTKAFWGKWAVKEEDVRAAVKKKVDFFRDQADAAEKAAGDAMPVGAGKLTEADWAAMEERGYQEQKHLIGTIGPMYGVLWRKFPRVSHNKPDWFNGIEDIPSDRLAELKEIFLAQVALANGVVKNDKETWENFAVGAYLRQGYDQLQAVLKNLKARPYSSRHRVTAFHPDLIGSESSSPEQNVMDGFGALAPCHTLFQFMVTDNDQGEKELNCMMYMSSSDVPLGRPYNIMQYSLLTMAMAHCLDYKLGKFTIVSCDTHIYANQMEKAKEQLMRTPKKDRAKVVFPADKKDLFAFEPEDFQILDYVSHERIDYPANK